MSFLFSLSVRARDVVRAVRPGAWKYGVFLAADKANQGVRFLLPEVNAGSFAEQTVAVGGYPRGIAEFLAE
jgi:hypothetical protein